MSNLPSGFRNRKSLSKVTSNNVSQTDAAQGGRTRVSRPYQVVKSGLEGVCCGLDKLEVTLYFKIENDSLFERLSRLKSEVQLGMQTAIPVSFSDSRIGRQFMKWNLQRTGTKLYPYVLKTGDVNLLLSSRSHTSPISNGKIEIGSVSCHEGVFRLYEKLITWLSVHGLVVHREVVSRVDLCADLLGQSISEYPIDDGDRWISRGVSFDPHYKHWKLTGISHGSSRLMMRIYDKALELKRDKTKEHFFYTLWGVPKKTPVTRVEFQLRRVVLKDFEEPVDTVSELQNNLDGLWQYLVCHWARFADAPVDRKNKNHKQATISRFWKIVQSLVFVVKSPPNWRSLKNNLHKNIRVLKDQAFGCLVSLAAAAGKESHDYDGIICEWMDILSWELKNIMENDASKFHRLFDKRVNESYLGF